MMLGNGVRCSLGGCLAPLCYPAFIALSDARVGRFEWSVRGESLPVSAWGTATPRKTSLRI